MQRKSIHFPFAGIRLGHEVMQRGAKYGAVEASNVYPIDSLESRQRGGSRPGLQPVGTVVSPSQTDEGVVATWQQAAGDYQHSLILRGADGEIRQIDLDGSLAGYVESLSGADAVSCMVHHQGKVFLVDGGIQQWNLRDDTLTTLDDVPVAATVACVYRDRLVCAGGLGGAWAASRSNKMDDWALVGEMSDPARPTTGQCSLPGEVGEPVVALIPNQDQELLVLSDSSIWCLTGPLTSGKMQRISGRLGIVGPRAWAVTPSGEVWAVSKKGLCKIHSRGIETHDGNVPREFLDMSADTQLRWDPELEALVLFDDTQCWAVRVDGETPTYWPMSFPEGYAPRAICRDRDRAVWVCDDGSLRAIDKASGLDGTTAIESSALVGPIRIAEHELMSAVLSQIAGTMVGVVEGSVWAGRTAEDVLAMAQADETPHATWTWDGSTTPAVRTRLRGSYIMIRFSSTTPWAFGRCQLAIDPRKRAR